jgi:hypothetical protein
MMAQSLISLTASFIFLGLYSCIFSGFISNLYGVLTNDGMFSTQRKMPAKRMPPEIRVVQKRRGKRQFNFERD